MINSFGLGTQFAALGGRVYELAREHGLGHEIPYEPHRAGGVAGRSDVEL